MYRSVRHPEVHTTHVSTTFKHSGRATLRDRFVRSGQQGEPGEPRQVVGGAEVAKHVRERKLNHAWGYRGRDNH